jgi:hypothetical protein
LNNYKETLFILENLITTWKNHHVVCAEKNCMNDMIEFPSFCSAILFQTILKFKFRIVAVGGATMERFSIEVAIIVSHSNFLLGFSCSFQFALLDFEVLLAF